MKKITLIVAFILAGITVNAQGIKFEKVTFAEAVTKAQKENKLVFIDFYTTWCGPCKAMDANIFPDKKVGDYFNEKFVSIKLDAEKGEGITLAQKYTVKGYPTLLFLNNDETEKDRLVGAAPNADFFVNYAKTALGEGIDFVKFYESYEKGNRDLDYIREIMLKGPVYAQGLKDEKEQREWYKKIYEIARWYFVLKQPQDMLNAEDFTLIAQYLDGPNNGHPVVEFVYDHYEDYKKEVPLKDLLMFIMRTNNQSIHDASGKGDLKFREYVEQFNTRLKQACLDSAKDEEEFRGDTYQVMKYVSEATYAKSQNDYDGYLDWSEKYRKYEATYREPDARGYSTTVGNLLLHVELGGGIALTPEQAKRCMKLVKEGLNLDEKNTMLLGNQGDLFVILGKNDKALACYNKVKEFVKGTRSESYYTEAMDKKIKGLK